MFHSASRDWRHHFSEGPRWAQHKLAELLRLVWVEHKLVFWKGPEVLLFVSWSHFVGFDQVFRLRQTSHKSAIFPRKSSIRGSKFSAIRPFQRRQWGLPSHVTFSDRYSCTNLRVNYWGGCHAVGQRFFSDGFVEAAWINPWVWT